MADRDVIDVANGHGEDRLPRSILDLLHSFADPLLPSSTLDRRDVVLARTTEDHAEDKVSKSEITACLKLMIDAGYPHEQIKDVLTVLVKKWDHPEPSLSHGGPTNSGEVVSDVLARRRAYNREYQRKYRLKVKKTSDVSDDAKSEVSIKEVVIDTEEEDKKRKKVRTSFVYSKDFDNFWLSYPRTPSMGKFETWKVWQKLPAEERALAAAAVPKFKAWLKTQKPDYPVVHACRFLSKKRFDGFQATQTPVNNLHLPPWEREGLTEAEYWKKQEHHNGKG